jgi:hypothetical protein
MDSFGGRKREREGGDISHVFDCEAIWSVFKKEGGQAHLRASLATTEKQE